MSTVSGLSCPTKLNSKDWDLVVAKNQMLITENHLDDGETQFEVAKNEMVAAEESWVIWINHQGWNSSSRTKYKVSNLQNKK